MSSKSVNNAGYANSPADSFEKNNSEVQNNLTAEQVKSSGDSFKKENSEIQNNFLTLTNKINPPLERRTQSVPVNVENRSGNDRRESERVSKVGNDIHKIQTIYKDFINSTSEVKAEVNKLDNSAVPNKRLVQAVFAALSPIIPFRRVSSVPDKVDNKDYVGVAGTVAVAGILLPEDLRDTRDAGRQIFKGILPKYNHKEFQTPFSFIRGSFLEPLVNKMTNKYGYYLHKWDKSLLDTRFGEKIKDLLNVKVIDSTPTGRFVPQIFKDEDTGKYFKQDKEVMAKKLEGSRIGKLICRGLQRTTVYGSLDLSAICIPLIVKAFMKPDNTKDKFINTGKQTAKSAISVVSTLAGIGLGGALLVSLGLGPVGSVVGMGMGCVIGAYISSKINKNIKTK